MPAQAASYSRLTLFAAAFILITVHALHAQECTVIGSTAPNAAGVSMPITSCTSGPDNSPQRRQPPPKPDVWGAIAVSSALDWGTSWNFNSQAAGDAEALRRCKLSAKGKPCKLAVSVADVCVSLVLSKPQGIYTIGGPIGAMNFADDNGSLKCQRAGGKACVVATSFCADGEKHVLQGRTVFSNGNPIFVPNGQSPGPLRR
jgi:hypothetical protein